LSGPSQWNIQKRKVQSTPIQGKEYYPMVEPGDQFVHRPSVPVAYPELPRNRELVVSAVDFRACSLAPDRVVAAIDEVTAEALLAAR
jgi:hypothetical protein